MYTINLHSKAFRPPEILCTYIGPVPRKREIITVNDDKYEVDDIQYRVNHGEGATVLAAVDVTVEPYRDQSVMDL